jgi:transposase
MRYAHGGGLTAKERGRREAVRLEAAEMFAGGASVTEVARGLRVTRMSANRWHQAWQAGGEDALASIGAAGAACKLTDAQLEQLGAELDEGPAAHGWEEDQRWTLARVAELIAADFGVDYTLRGVGYLLHRIGFTVQVPDRKAVERDEAAIARWRQEQWPIIKGRPAT